MQPEGNKGVYFDSLQINNIDLKLLKGNMKMCNSSYWLMDELCWTTPRLEFVVKID